MTVEEATIQGVVSPAILGWLRGDQKGHDVLVADDGDHFRLVEPIQSQDGVFCMIKGRIVGHKRPKKDEAQTRY